MPQIDPTVSVLHPGQTARRHTAMLPRPPDCSTSNVLSTLETASLILLSASFCKWPHSHSASLCASSRRGSREFFQSRYELSQVCHRYRRMQELSLQTAYRCDHGIRACCRQLLALPLMPHEHIACSCSS